MYSTYSIWRPLTFCFCLYWIYFLIVLHCPHLAKYGPNAPFFFIEDTSKVHNSESNLLSPNFQVHMSKRGIEKGPRSNQPKQLKWCGAAYKTLSSPITEHMKMNCIQCLMFYITETISKALFFCNRLVKCVLVFFVSS